MRRTLWTIAIAAAAAGWVGGCGGNGSGDGSREGADVRDAGSDGISSNGGTDVDAGGTSDSGSERDSSNDEYDVASPDGDVSTAPAPKIWRLSRGSDEWSIFDQGGRPARYAPTEPIRAAFDIEHSAFVFVLTDSHLHKIQIEPAPPRWKPPADLSQLDADFATAQISAAASNPEDSPDDAVAIYGRLDGAETVWRASYDFDGESFEMFESKSFDGMHEEAPALADVLAAWRDNDNARDWFGGEPPCGTSPDDRFGAYVGYLTADTVHFQDVWYCDGYFRATPIAETSIPSTGRPDPSKLGASVWHGGDFYLFEK